MKHVIILLQIIYNFTYSDHLILLFSSQTEQSWSFKALCFVGKTLDCQRSFLFPCATSIYMAFSASSVLFSAEAAKAEIYLLMKGQSPLSTFFLWKLISAFANGKIALYGRSRCAALFFRQRKENFCVFQVTVVKKCEGSSKLFFSQRCLEEE